MELIEKAKQYVSEKVQEKIENIPKPEATLHGLRLDGVGWDGISYKATVGIMNPYPHSIPLCDVAYVLKSDGRVILSGNMPDPGDIAGKHETTKLDVEIKVPHSAVVSLVRDIWQDWDIDYELEVTLTIDIPIIRSFHIPLSTSGEIKLPTISDFWGGGKEDEKRDKEGDKDKDDDDKDKEKRREKKRDEDEDEDEEDKGGISSIPIIGSLLGRGGSDDEKEKENDEDKSGDDGEYKEKRKDKKKGTDEDEEEKGTVNIPIISDLLAGRGSDDEKDKDRDSDDECKDKKKKKKKKDDD